VRAGDAPLRRDAYGSIRPLRAARPCWKPVLTLAVFAGVALWKVILLPLFAGFMDFLLKVAVLVAFLPH